MKLAVTMTGLTPEQWRQAQENIRTEYAFRDTDSRVCLTLEHDGEERHVEVPLSDFLGVMFGLSLISLSQAIRDSAGCKCAFRAPELGPHPACLVHTPADEAAVPRPTSVVTDEDGRMFGQEEPPFKTVLGSDERLG